jgi:hypothetical protein
MDGAGLAAAAGRQMVVSTAFLSFSESELSARRLAQSAFSAEWPGKLRARAIELKPELGSVQIKSTAAMSPVNLVQ